MACKLAAASALATVGVAIIGPGTGTRVPLYEDALVHHNDYDSNFIVQQFSGANFPHAMGTCNPDSLIPQNYWIFQCVNDTHARRHTFSTDTCAASSWAGTETLSNEGIDDRNEGWFYCGGCDGYYAEVEFAAGSCDAPKKSVLSGALNSCADLGDGNKSLSIWCEGGATVPKKAEMQYFFAQNCSDRTSWLYSYYTEEECSFLFEFETSSQAAIDVVANILHCRLGLDDATWNQWSAPEYDEFMNLPGQTTKQRRVCSNDTFYPTESPTPRPTPLPTQSAAAGFGLAVVAALSVAAAAEL